MKIMSPRRFFFFLAFAADICQSAWQRITIIPFCLEMTNLNMTSHSKCIWKRIRCTDYIIEYHRFNKHKRPDSFETEFWTIW